MSPAGVDRGTSTAWYVSSNGSPFTTSPSYPWSLCAVINLNADVTVTGSGTSTDPYVVQ